MTLLQLPRWLPMNGDGESSSALAKGGWRLKDDRAILSTHLLSLSLASAEGRSRGPAVCSAADAVLIPRSPLSMPYAGVT